MKTNKPLMKVKPVAPVLGAIAFAISMAVPGPLKAQTPQITFMPVPKTQSGAPDLIASPQGGVTPDGIHVYFPSAS
jgi:hypothetical protein